MALITLQDYHLTASDGTVALAGVYFELAQGEACRLTGDDTTGASLLLRALATLQTPVGGVYRFKGKRLDFSDYRRLLPLKRRIGYIAPDAALVSNRTLRENLLLSRLYGGDCLALTLDDATAQLCHAFDMGRKLDERPSALSLMDVRLSVALRELIKQPEVLIIERPENCIGHNKLPLFTDTLQALRSQGLAVVFQSDNRHFNRQMAGRRLRIEAGRLAAQQAPGQGWLSDEGR